jgi:hypothetical protein
MLHSESEVMAAVSLEGIIESSGSDGQRWRSSVNSVIVGVRD